MALQVVFKDGRVESFPEADSFDLMPSDRYRILSLERETLAMVHRDLVDHIEARPKPGALARVKA